MNRVPPTLGMVGVDIGAKPAITLVIPAKRLRLQEDFIPSDASPCIHCEDVDDGLNFWPEGELPPVVGSGMGSHPWKHYCLRQFVYDRNKTTGALSNKRVYKVTSGPVYTVTTNWYNFDAGAVTDALTDMAEPPPGPCSAELPMAVHLLVQFYRERADNPTPPPNRIVVGDETNSFVQVLQLCYSYGVNIDELYEIS